MYLVIKRYLMIMLSFVSLQCAVRAASDLPPRRSAGCFFGVVKCKVCGPRQKRPHLLFFSRRNDLIIAPVQICSCSKNPDYGQFSTCQHGRTSRCRGRVNVFMSLYRTTLIHVGPRNVEGLSICWFFSLEGGNCLIV